MCVWKSAFGKVCLLFLAYRPLGNRSPRGLNNDGGEIDNGGSGRMEMLAQRHANNVPNELGKQD